MDTLKIDIVSDIVCPWCVIGFRNLKKAMEVLKSELDFDVNFVLDKYYNINNLNFSADKTNIRLSHLKLNKNFEVKDFKKLEIKTYENEIKNNDFLVKKLKKVVMSGEVFDAQPLLQSLYKKNYSSLQNKFCHIFR